MRDTDMFTAAKSDSSSNGKRKAIIIGAGPAGLTAAYELLKRTDIIPVILEKSGDIGGISKTVNYKGNRMDIGGHRFFSKSDRVMNWWLNIFPVKNTGQESINISYQYKSREIHGSDATVADADKVMLVRKRLSRIYFLRRFFAYPIQLSFDTLRKLGLWTTVAILFSYLKSQLFPRKPERHLEDFMINRFGRILYELFFKDYTEKVWGQTCDSISAEWGAQRIKGVSVSKAMQHAVETVLKRKRKDESISQKDTETSLIEQFLYPKYGPGQLWEEVARQVEEMGGVILKQHDVKRIYSAESGDKITAVAAVNSISGETGYLEGDYFFSTMPVQELIGGMDGLIPEEVREVAAGLQYRDFITVGILLKSLSFQDKDTGEWKPLVLKDTWIYIQERDVKVGRLQVFNNWSPFMVKDPDTVWVGMEFFCNKEDSFWQLPDNSIKQLAIHELEKTGLASDANVLDATVLRMEKTYPAYFGTYERFDIIREYVDRFENLFLVGRNGMHKYNNADHSMLTAMVAVDNICTGEAGKANIWTINTEQEYQEEIAEKKKVEEDHLSAAKEQHPAAVMTFKDFLFKQRENRRILRVFGAAMFILFILFKYLYPFANYIHGDSFSYLRMAKNNVDIDTHPIGYARFLRFFSVFSSWDMALVACQYLMIQCSALFLLFSVFYFYKQGKGAQRIQLAFVVLNPLPLYLANLISSDAIFLGLSLSWFALLLWIVQRPGTRIIVAHAFVLFVAFTFRYNALIYPVIAVAAFGISRLSPKRKLVGLGLCFLLCGLFVVYTGSKYKALTGTWQFSPFSGWQLANNAMYAYREVDGADRKPVPERFRKLDGMIRSYFDTTLRHRMPHPLELEPASTIYMWSRGTPLQVYKDKQFPGDTSKSASFKRWASVAPLYNDYGRYIIRQYPKEFAIHYLWPNTRKYYAPPVEFLEQYNGGRDSVGIVAQEWFGYKSRKVTARLWDAEPYTLGFYPVLSGMMNVLLVCCLLCFFVLNGHRMRTPFRRILVMVILLWLVNAGFTIFASPAALRFQAFPMMLVTIFSIALVDWMIQQMNAIARGKVNKKQHGAKNTVKAGGLLQA